MELKELLVIVGRRWWLILLLGILGGGAAFGITLLIPPQYEASTTILVNPAKGVLTDAEAVINGQRVAATYAELLQQRPVLEQVIKDLHLFTDSDALGKQIQVNPVRDTNLLILTVRDTDPGRAANIANGVVQVFIKQNEALQSQQYASSVQDLQRQLDSLQQEMNTTQARIQTLANSTSTADIAERNQLQDLLVADRNSYTTLKQSLEQIKLAQAQTSDTVNVVETAQPGKSVVSLPLNIALGTIIGLMSAVGLIFLIEYLQETVKSHDEIEDLVGAPTLGVIGQIQTSGFSALVTVDKPHSPIAEAYRLLRANLDFAGQDPALRTLLVTSSSPAEGKTTTLVNLAIATAQFGKQVILVDADLRRPMLHKIFRQPNTRGLSTAIQQEGGVLHDHLVPTGVENLYLMPSGPQPPNPADMLGSRRMVDLLDKLKTVADAIYFDSPPLLAVADSALLARWCDATLMVVLSESTRGDVLRRAKEQLEQSGAHLVGVVLNKVSTRRDGYYYYQRYYYSSKE